MTRLLLLAVVLVWCVGCEPLPQPPPDAIQTFCVTFPDGHQEERKAKHIAAAYSSSGCFRIHINGRWTEPDEEFCGSHAWRRGACQVDAEVKRRQGKESER